MRSHRMDSYQENVIRVGNLNTSPDKERSTAMNLTPEQRDQVVAELKRVGADLQLTDEQKTKLQQFLTEARAKVAEYHEANPNATKADIIKQVAANRDQIRQRLVNFLSHEELKKCDDELYKTKHLMNQQK